MDVDKLIDKLGNDTDAIRRTAMEALAGMPPEKTLAQVASLLLRCESGDVCADCLDLLDRFEASASLAEIRMDGWFDQIAGRIPNLSDIAAIMGEHFLAYAFILNIQIRSLSVDPLSPANTAVHFSGGDDRVQVLSLGEFKLRAVQALSKNECIPMPPALPFTTEAATALLGGRALLLAPLFHISVDRVILADPNPEHPEYLITFISDGRFHVESLPEFEERIRASLRADLSGMAEQPFTLDLFAVARAREAAAVGNRLAVIEILESWPGLLSVLHRTTTAKSLDDEQLALIAEGVALLGEALEAVGRTLWAEELYKLGLQFVRETKEAGRLMANLAKMLISREGFGESIGLLRRALFLGVPECELLPLLGRAFLKQKKLTAARALLETCAARGYEGSYLDADLAEARQAFETVGTPWQVPLEEVAS